jgi:hypothetical protein
MGTLRSLRLLFCERALAFRRHLAGTSSPFLPRLLGRCALAPLEFTLARISNEVHAEFVSLQCGIDAGDQVGRDKAGFGPSAAPSHAGVSRDRFERCPRRKHLPKPNRRRALELLVSCRDGCTEAIMIAHGFTIEQMVELVRAGLASATAERVVAGRRTMEIARVRITEAGRRALVAR